MKILNAAASAKANLGEDLDRQQIPALTGVAGSSTIRNALTKLNRLGWIEPPYNKKITVSSEGMDHANIEAATIPSSNADYHDRVKKQRKLKSKAIAIFDLIVDGKEHSKKEVADLVFDGKKNSTFRNTLADLKVSTGSFSAFHCIPSHRRCSVFC